MAIAPKIQYIRAMDEAAQLAAPQTAPHGASRASWLVYVPVLLLAYFLTTGPAAWIQGKVPNSADVIDFVYAPVGYLADKCPPFQAALDWYLVKIWRLEIAPVNMTDVPRAGP